MESSISRWSVRGDWCTSDHKAISIEVAKAPEGAREDGDAAEPARFDVRRADWDRFSKVFQEKATSTLREFPLDTAGSVEDAAERLAGIIIEACEASMPRERRRLRPNPWWTAQLSEMRKRVIRARRRLFRARQNPRRAGILKKEWSLLVRKYHRMIFEARQKSWRKFTSGHGNEEPWGIVYKISADKFRPKTVISTVRGPGGQETTSMRDTAKRLLDVHVPDDDPLKDTPEQAAIRAHVAQLHPDTLDADPFDGEMVLKAIKTMRNGKAPGPDLVEVEALKAAYKAQPDIFLKIFNACLEHGVFPRVWKKGKMITLLKGQDKDPSDPKYYRPICLLSVIGKLLEKLIKMRLEESVLGKLSDRQYGFRSGNSCEDAIVELRRLVASSDSKYTVGLLFDIEGAFDNVWWPLVLKNLAELGCQHNIFNLISHYFSDREVFIHWGSEFVSKEATRGCPQGSVLGPICWNVMFDAIIKAMEQLSRLHPNILPPVDYADDKAVVIKGDSRDGLEKDCQRVVDTFVGLCTAAKLTVSAKKTEGIMLKRVWHKNAPMGKGSGYRRKAQVKPTLSSKPPLVRIGDKKIIFKDKVVYLGIHFDRDLKVHSHVAHIRAKTGRLFGKLRRVANAGWGLRFGALRTIYNGVFLPVVTYASAGWSDLCNAHDLRGLRAAQRQALITSTGAYRTISHDSACVVAGALPVDLLLEQSRARYQVRVGNQGVIGDLTVEPGSADAVFDIKAKAIDLWGARYAALAAEGTHAISTFFPTLADRLQSDWVRPNHFVTQVLSGHGSFRDFLASRGIIPREETACSCGAERDTVQHFLLDCPIFEPQRVALRELTEGNEWPEVARTLVSSPEAFKLLSRFCVECLGIRENESRCAV